MKFKYKKIASGLVRPIIPIDLSYKHFSPISYEALADSGDDICIDIGGYQYIVNAAFSYSAKLQYGFLGHRGIFNKFIIQFQTRKEVVEFRQETNIN